LSSTKEKEDQTKERTLILQPSPVSEEFEKSEGFMLRVPRQLKRDKEEKKDELDEWEGGRGGGGEGRANLLNARKGQQLGEHKDTRLER